MKNVPLEYAGCSMKIKIKYLSDIEPIQKITTGNWIDLRCAETILIRAGEFKLLPLGVAMKLPENYEAHIVPRSSTFKNFGLIQSNHFGVVDNSYSGNNDEWKFGAIAARDVTIHKNDRICQFRIDKIQPEIEFEEVDNLDENDRGGFGSTGIS